MYNHERDLFCSNSHLTLAAVKPSKIERQKVRLVLDVFCDHTVSALKTSTCSDSEAKDTADFISQVISLWKLMNCKSQFEANRRNDSDRSVLDFSEQGQRAFTILDNWAEHRIIPKYSKGTSRVKTLTRDTGDAISWTCKSLIALSRHLLSTDSVFKHDYVKLGFFQQDDLEKHFAHFRRSAGCVYYITAKEVFATHNLDRARKMLKACEEEDFSDIPSTHSCHLCDNKALNEADILLMHELPDQIEGISHDDSLNLFYMAGYVAFRHIELRGNRGDFDSDSTSFLDEMDRGKLSYPNEALFNFIKLAFLFFTNTEKLCRRRFMFILSEFPSFFLLDIFLHSEPLSRIANLFFKRFSKNIGQIIYTKSKKPRSATVAKLSSGSSK